MYPDWGANAAVVGATLLAVAASVLIHYEGLVVTNRRLARLGGQRHVRVLYGLGAVLALHVAEIWVFGALQWSLLHWPECGRIVGQPEVGLLDAVYLSATTYTTVGYGDLAPVGPIRLLAGTESLLGLLLITWSASFTYLEMERYWRKP